MAKEQKQMSNNNKPYILTENRLALILSLRKRAFETGTKSRYLQQQTTNKLACRHCGQELVTGQPIVPGLRGARIASKYYCKPCAKLLHIL